MKRFLIATVLCITHLTFTAHNTALTVKKQLLLQNLSHLGMFKHGNFILKGGKPSPFYIDLRSIITYPDMLNTLAECIHLYIEDLSFDVLCAVPYGAVPIATAVSLIMKKPMIMPRNEAKNHGMQKVIDGVYRPGDRCVVIEDVMTTGNSILETVATLENAGLIVSDIVVCVDREQNGFEHLRSKGYTVHVLYTFSDIIRILHEDNVINDEQYAALKHQNANR